MHYSNGLPGVGMLAVGRAMPGDDLLAYLARLLLDLAGGLFVAIAAIVLVLHLVAMFLPSQRVAGLPRQPVAGPTGIKTAREVPVRLPQQRAAPDDQDDPLATVGVGLALSATVGTR